MSPALGRQVAPVIPLSPRGATSLAWGGGTWMAVPASPRDRDTEQTPVSSAWCLRAREGSFCSPGRPKVGSQGTPRSCAACQHPLGAPSLRDTSCPWGGDGAELGTAPRDPWSAQAAPMGAHGHITRGDTVQLTPPCSDTLQGPVEPSGLEPATSPRTGSLRSPPPTHWSFPPAPAATKDLPAPRLAPRGDAPRA